MWNSLGLNSFLKLLRMLVIPNTGLNYAIGATYGGYDGLRTIEPGRLVAHSDQVMVFPLEQSGQKGDEGAQDEQDEKHDGDPANIKQLRRDGGRIHRVLSRV